MPIRNFKPFKFPEANQPGRRDVQALHAVLKNLRIPVAKEEIRRGELGDATKEAIKEFQPRAKLRVDDVIGPKTVAGLQSEIAHAFIARSKTRTANLHEKLQRLGYELDAKEVKGRLYGASTEEALKDFQKKHRLPADGRMSPDLFETVGAAALDKRFTTKRQAGALQRKLLRAIRIAKLDVRIDPTELKKQELGPTTKAAIKAFQKKYKLKDSGKLDPVTFERLESVAASRPMRTKMLKVKSAETLVAPTRPLRLNMVNGRVGDPQRPLAVRGHKVAKHARLTRTPSERRRRSVLCRRSPLPEMPFVASKAWR
jgi:peptidoglycan hydrolase-like protein with peptidoglycan-binding domain